MDQHKMFCQADNVKWTWLSFQMQKRVKEVSICKLRKLNFAKRGSNVRPHSHDAGTFYQQPKQQDTVQLHRTSFTRAKNPVDLESLFAQ